jgi:hypothetical protein
LTQVSKVVSPSGKVAVAQLFSKTSINLVSLEEIITSCSYLKKDEILNECEIVIELAAFENVIVHRYKRNSEDKTL